MNLAPVPPEIRARALRALLVLADARHDTPLEECWEQAVPQLMPCELAATELASEEDLALANACLELEHELREQEFAAIETLLGSLPPSGDADLDDRLRRLPLVKFAQAASGLYSAGWIYDV
jgi:hypothetical protein